MFDHRLIRDLNLLLSEFALGWALISLVAICFGLLVAFRYWYRPVNGLVLEQLELLKQNLETAEQKIDRMRDGTDALVPVTNLEAEVRKLRADIQRIGKQQVVVNKGNSQPVETKVIPEPKKESDSPIFEVNPAENVDYVVFILDISRSMNGGKLEHCQKRLKEALNNLKSDAMYQVIFFSQTAGFADDETGATWRSATLENITATIGKVTTVETAYGNEWDKPIILAMQLEPPPKRIDFLTDGEKSEAGLLSKAIIDLVKRVDGETVVNTIALMAPQASPPLFEIAEHTGGRHQLVLPGGRIIEDKGQLKSYLDN